MIEKKWKGAPDPKGVTLGAYLNAMILAAAAEGLAPMR